MSAAAPWSVKGIEPKAREIAKDLARRSGMTLGEWLNTMILEDDDGEEGVVPLARRSHAADTVERRGRYRRVDDAYTPSYTPPYSPPEESRDRLSASIDAIAARLEASERRSTVAIQGVDQAVTGLVRRLEGQDQAGAAHNRRIDDIAEELREGHKRLRHFEQEVGPRTLETFDKVETSIGALAGRLYDIEERQRTGVNELRQRMEQLETVAGPGPGSDLLATVAARLDAAQASTGEALRGLERSFAGLDQRLRAAETRAEPESSREAARFEKLAETLTRQIEANRTDMMRRLDTAETEGRMARIEKAVTAIGEQARTSDQRSAQAVESMGREVLRIAQNLNGRIGKVEADVPGQLARLGDQLTKKVEKDMGRYVQVVDQRLVSSDDRHALALEKLGGEITRISDRLSDRIAQSERRSAQALEDIAKRMADSSSTIEQRYDRASGELAERMRLSEERTARLLVEARDSMEQRAKPVPAPTPAPAPPPDLASSLAQPDWRADVFKDDDFSSDFDDGNGWSDHAAAGDPAPFPGAVAAAAPLGSAVAAEAVRDPVLLAPEAEPEVEPETQPASEPILPPAPEAVAVPFGSPAGTAPVSVSFGGADVSDALEVTASVPVTEAPAGFADVDEDFAAETDFVDARALRAAAAAGRAASTRQTIDAARAAMAPPAVEEPPRAGFGLKRGGKSRLQERLDKQAARDGGTVRKALGASAAAVLLTAGGFYAYGELTGAGMVLPQFSLGGTSPSTDAPLLALATTPTALTPATPEETAELATLYATAVEQMDAGDTGGIETLTRAASLGYAPAQLHLAGLYETGQGGVTVNAEESRLWARRAADGGDARGMHAYGMYLFDGVGGARNRREALDWLLKAADRGLVDSQFNVARIYESGDEGVAANPGEAYKWYLIAANAADADARDAAARLEPRLSSTVRRTARTAAAAFQVEPLA
ncbi:hypothetical protein [uncultured Brevundimonas sp.]|uniref:SEL1-like repeat protein n=1 Tax=uncultured Brevundimonas sp. TaxID=213418 RepID=UPI0030EC9F06